MRSVAHPPRYKPPIPAIRIGASDRTPAESRYGTRLVWFMRLLSLMWALQGLDHWASVLLADGEGIGALDTLSGLGVTAVIFFSVIDLIAAVGLWLASAWGGVVWLVAVGAQWISTLILPGFFQYDRVVSCVGLLLTVVYFYLTYKAARENEPYL